MDEITEAVARYYPEHDEFAVLPLEMFDRMRAALRAAGLAEALDDVSFLPLTLERPTAEVV